jgi:AbiV family abortive infection protein
MRANMPWDPNLRPLLRACSAAIRNAEDLYQDARLLLRAGRRPRAAALAVIGSEEAGKAVAFMLAGFGKVPRSHLPTLLKNLRTGKESHRSKQAVSQVGWLAGKAHRELGQLLQKVVAGTRNSPPDNDELARFAAAHLSQLIPSVLNIVEQTVGDWQRLNHDVELIADGSLQRIRDQGLYVDFKDDHVHTPWDIPPRQATQLVNRLELIVRGLQPMAKLGMWADEAVTAIAGVLPDPEDPEAQKRFWEAARALTPGRGRTKRAVRGRDSSGR